MKKVIFQLVTLALLWGCKPYDAQSNLTTNEEDTSQEISILLEGPLPRENQTLINALTEGEPITFDTLETAANRLNSFVSPPVKYENQTTGAGVRVQSRNRNKPGYNEYSGYDTYRGVNIGRRVFIFKLGAQQAFEYNDSWSLFGWVPDTVLQKRGTEAQVKHFLDAKVYEPRRIATMQKFLDQAEFAARFIPAYAGAENAFYGTSTSGRVLGVVQMVGDLATLGIGTSIKVVSKTASVITITAASTRVGVAASRYANGSATSGDGIDAFLATVEAGIGAISVVKIKLSGARAIVKNADEAALLSKHLRRSPDDILENGISKEELKKLVGDLPQLRHLDDAADDLSRVAKRLDDVPNPCTALGLVAKGLCSVRNPLKPATLTEAETMLDLLSDGDHLAYYTSERIIKKIAENGVLLKGGKGLVYVTDEAFDSAEAFSKLFIHNPKYAGKGSHVVIFKRQKGAKYTPYGDPKSPVTELVHEGTIRLNPDDAVYLGPNPFDLLR